MFIHDDKKALMTIMAKRGEKGGERVLGPSPVKPEVSMSEGGEIDGRHTAAQDVILAMSEKSPEKLVQAMANFMDMHMAKNAEMDSEPDADDE